ncbi:MAG: phosphate regulon transcriptional regulator PhoB [Chromatiales bacterium]|nr:phosphate regulon transcriptional regulator PhoB [Chromatiales bacterium]
MSTRILLVEDEEPVRTMTAFALEKAGFTVEQAETVKQAERYLQDGLPDLLLIDWMLPDVSGIEFARRLSREETTREIPLIMLTARGEESDKLHGFEAGFDDYITKPFSPRELVARIKAVLRRSSAQTAEGVLQAEELVLDPTSHRLTANGEALEVGPTEYRLLHFFMSHPERVYSRSQLLDRVWGSNVYIEERTVDVHIRRLRKALSEQGFDRFIQTVRGAGYRFSTKA